MAARETAASLLNKDHGAFWTFQVSNPGEYTQILAGANEIQKTQLTNKFAKAKKKFKKKKKIF